MEERICYLTVKVCYRTNGTYPDPASMINENCNYNVEMPAGYGIEIFDTELVAVEG